MPTRLEARAGGERPAPAEALLDTYEEERVPVAQRLLNTTDRAFRLVVSDSWLAGCSGRKVACARIAAKVDGARADPARSAFRVVSPRPGSLSRQRASLVAALDGLPEGAPSAGDRFPWLRLKFQGGRHGRGFLRKLDDTCFNLIVFGQPVPKGCAGTDGLMNTYSVVADLENDAVLTRAQIPACAFYLVRPDGYVGLCGTRADATAINRYLADCVRLSSSSPTRDGRRGT